MDIDYSLKEDFRQCMEYLNVCNEESIPERSSRRPKIDKIVDSSIYKKESEETFSDSSEEYNLGADTSAQSSLFSDTPNLSHIEREYPESLLEQYLDEVSSSDEIGVVEDVVTIVRKHDRWDPKKVSLISY